MHNTKSFDTCDLLDQGGARYSAVRRVLQGWILSEAPKVIVEIGTYKGHTTACMALTGAKFGKAERPRIYTIDPDEWKQRRTVENYCGLKHRVAFVCGRAQEVPWDGEPIDMLFIDGDHSYEGTRAIFERWSQWVRPGGKIFMHDANIRKVGNNGVEYGVWRVWDEIQWPKMMLMRARPGFGVVEKPEVPCPAFGGKNQAPNGGYLFVGEQAGEDAKQIEEMKRNIISQHDVPESIVGNNEASECKELVDFVNHIAEFALHEKADGPKDNPGQQEEPAEVVNGMKRRRRGAGGKFVKKGETE